MASFAHFYALVSGAWIRSTLRPDGAVTRFGSKRALQGFDPSTTLITSVRNVDSAAVLVKAQGLAGIVADSPALRRKMQGWKAEAIKPFAEGFMSLAVVKGRKDAQATLATTLAFYR